MCLELLLALDNRLTDCGASRVAVEEAGKHFRALPQVHARHGLEDLVLGTWVARPPKDGYACRKSGDTQMKTLRNNCLSAADDLGERKRTRPRRQSNCPISKPERLGRVAQGHGHRQFDDRQPIPRSCGHHPGDLRVRTASGAATVER